MVKKKQILKEKTRKETDRECKTETDGKEKRYKRGKPRIVSNIQLVPPNQSNTNEEKIAKTEEEWITVGKKKKRKGNKKGDLLIKANNKYNNKRDLQTTQGNYVQNPKNSGHPRLKRVPKTAAITITAKEGVSYADILRHAREKITLTEIGIDMTKIRRGINDGLIIEIAGEENVKKAATLATKLIEILPDKDKVGISQPTAMADIKISGLDDSVTSEEIETMIADNGDCCHDDIKVGRIRWLPNGLGAIWVRCPTRVANKIAATGKIKVGWTVAKIEILPPRPLQCYRCWNFGHVRYSCSSRIDRSNHCYRCGTANIEVTVVMH